ncbi:MAG: tetratricopeptide repeat protein [Bacteroidetes bacterium]|nr:tetratricopeptide repeat protein [Bacteroidota bacterium]
MKLKKIYCLFLPLSLCFSQNGRIDSLKSLLPNSIGEERLEILYAVSAITQNSFPKESFDYAAEAIPLAVEYHKQDTLSRLYGISSFTSTITGNFSLGLEFGFKSLALAKSIGNERQMGSAHSVIGVNYVFSGQYSKALEHHREALKIRTLHQDSANIISTLNNIGLVYHYIGMYEKAIGYFKEAMRLKNNSMDTLSLIRFNHNLGLAELKLGHYELAQQYLSTAVKLAEEKNYEAGKAYSYYGSGLLNIAENKFPEAIENITKAKNLNKQLSQQYGLAQADNGLGTAYFYTGEFVKAITELESAIDIAKKLNTPDILKDSYQLLYKIYEQKGNSKKAFTYFKLYSAAKDTLFNTAENGKIADLSANLETMQQERIIENLKQEKMIDDLRLTKEQYNTTLLYIGVAFLGVIIFVLYLYNRKIHTAKNAIEHANTELVTLNNDLQDKIDEIKTLSGLLPICSNCKKIRNDGGYWQQLEGYIAQHSSAKFSHGICPDCLKELYPDYAKKKGLL